jgi:chromosome segregation ATPase
MLKLANPLEYPLAVLAAGVVLVAGARVLAVPTALNLPIAGIVATGGAVLLKSREPNEEKIAQQQLKQELETIQLLSQDLAEKAEKLRKEADHLLADSKDFQLELLVAVQTACDRVVQLPQKIEQLGRKISATKSLISVEKLQQQLADVQNKIPQSSGVARQKLQELAESLQRNIKLAQAGQDTREAQLINLQTMVQNSAGILQQLQNNLRTANLNNSEDLQQLKELSDELNSYQKNVEGLMS